MAAPTAQRLRVKITAAHGDTDGSQRTLVDFTEATTTTGNIATVISKEYAASAANQSLDLSTFVDTASWIFIRDRGGTGINVNTVSGGTPFQVTANKYFGYANANATPPTLYFTNPSAVDKAFIEVVILGSAS